MKELDANQSVGHSQEILFCECLRLALPLVVEQADTDEKTAFGVFPTTRKHSAWRNEDFYKSSIEFGKLESSASAAIKRGATSGAPVLPCANLLKRPPPCIIAGKAACSVARL